MKLFAAVALAIVAATPAFANTPYSRGICLFSYGSEVQLNGPCEYTLDKDGSLYVSDVPASKGNLFAYVNLNGDGTADASWNGGGGASHAHDPLGTMTRKGGCWGNDLNVVCVWKVGTRPSDAEVERIVHSVSHTQEELFALEKAAVTVCPDPIADGLTPAQVKSCVDREVIEGQLEGRGWCYHGADYKNRHWDHTGRDVCLKIHRSEEESTFKH
jgi:hypothetical protein